MNRPSNGIDEACKRDNSSKSTFFTFFLTYDFFGLTIFPYVFMKKEEI